jgi:phospholipase/lecithinase/hemolysin
MSDTPISDSTPHNVAELGMLCRRFERELNAANAIIRQQQLLDEENLRLKDRIKRLEEAGDKAILNSYLPDRLAVWHQAKEAKP